MSGSPSLPLVALSFLSSLLRRFGTAVLIHRMDAVAKDAEILVLRTRSPPSLRVFPDTPATLQVIGRSAEIAVTRLQARF
jgi:hypothetical protein